MFSSGQLIFGGLFALVFITIIVFAYRKDLKLHQKNYKGVKWVAFFFILFLLTLFIIKYMLKN